MIRTEIEYFLLEFPVHIAPDDCFKSFVASRVASFNDKWLTFEMHIRIKDSHLWMGVVSNVFL